MVLECHLWSEIKRKSHMQLEESIVNSMDIFVLAIIFVVIFTMVWCFKFSQVCLVYTMICKNYNCDSCLYWYSILFKNYHKNCKLNNGTCSSHCKFHYFNCTFYVCQFVELSSTSSYFSFVRFTRIVTQFTKSRVNVTTTTKCFIVRKSRQWSVT